MFTSAPPMEMGAPMGAPVDYFLWNRHQVGLGVLVGTAGLLLRARAALEVGRMLTLRIRLPGAARAFTCLGRVVADAGQSMFDVRFVDLGFADRQVLEAFVARRLLGAAG